MSWPRSKEKEYDGDDGGDDDGDDDDDDDDETRNMLVCWPLSLRPRGPSTGS